MKKLVFLHGAGADKNAYASLVEKIAEIFSAELISFNAPFSHKTKPNKYVWFNKYEKDGRRDAVEDEYFHSLKFIEEKLLNLDTDLNDIIVLGHSQGGMAVHAGLKLNLNKVISICGDLPYNIRYESSSDTPIYWYEGGKDCYIDGNRKASHKFLDDFNNNLHYFILPNSTHNEFSDDLLKALSVRK